MRMVFLDLFNCESFKGDKLAAIVKDVKEDVVEELKYGKVLVFVCRFGLCFVSFNSIVGIVGN